MAGKRKPVVIWREWGLKGPLREQVATAKAAREGRLTRRDGEKVRAITTHTKRRL